MIVALIPVLRPIELSPPHLSRTQCVTYQLLCLRHPDMNVGTTHALADLRTKLCSLLLLRSMRSLANV